jgi:hypothetical protein
LSFLSFLPPPGKKLAKPPSFFYFAPGGAGTGPAPL